MLLVLLLLDLLFVLRLLCLHHRDLQLSLLLFLAQQELARRRLCRRSSGRRCRRGIDFIASARFAVIVSRFAVEALRRRRRHTRLLLLQNHARIETRSARKLKIANSK